MGTKPLFSLANKAGDKKKNHATLILTKFFAHTQNN